MASRVLVAVDGSEQSTAALEHAIVEHPEADLIAIHVIDILAGMYGEHYVDYQEIRTGQEQRAEGVLNTAEEIAGEHDRDLTTETIVGKPATAIVDAAEEQDVDQIVIGSRGRSGVSRVLLGSVAETVVRRSPVPVTVVR
ncbi:universal stress protein [Natranaeroarchaeum aerophilus]|uniref:Universal stress protein n=1 Tax=Natranaeroarchaeum aerophilus TaxID=2917711 RepID=A0AAE3FPN5_9EURY|nr:universal stress protein [Natranaeroarchaeum aerophilus]MCL9813367.1 universal stress protein [Natranaeroarchaeum aerophilus]